MNRKLYEEYFGTNLESSHLLPLSTFASRSARQPESMKLQIEYADGGSIFLLLIVDALAQRSNESKRTRIASTACISST